jgi:hypothetical protein
MERFLNKESVQNSQNRARRYIRILCVLCFLALALFAVLCLLTRTGNAQSMLYPAMAVMLLSGWGVIALWLFVVEPARAEAQHLAGLAEAEPEIREGRFSLTADSFRIPKSVRIRKARLQTESETLSLNVNEKLAGRMPPDDSLVRAEIVRKFITGVEVLEPGPVPVLPPKHSRLRPVMRGLRRFLLPAVLWGFMAVILTGFIFGQITDTSPENKITIFADCEVQYAPELAEKLEKALNGTVRMVKVHPFSYAMFDTVRLRQADLYIVPDSHLAEYREWFSGEKGPAVYDPAAGTALLESYFNYVPGETYRLYIGAGSVHLEDGLAERSADLLISLAESEKLTNK